MATRNKLDLETDPRAIIGVREFDAPRDLVFSAWTDPRPSGAVVGAERLHHDHAQLRHSGRAASGGS